MFFYSRKSRRGASDQSGPSTEDRAQVATSADEEVHVEVELANTSNNNTHSTTNKYTTPGGNTPSPTSPTNPSPSARGPINTSLRDTSSPSSNPRMSRDSEGYPSWLPQRPPPPPPASTFHSSVGMSDFEHEFGFLRGVYRDPDPSGTQHDASDLLSEGAVGEHSEEIAQQGLSPSDFGGRKPTPRSVRIVSLQKGSQAEEDEGDEVAIPDAVEAKPSDRRARPQKHVHGQVRAPTAAPGPSAVFPVLSRAVGAGVPAAAAQAGALSAPSHPRFNARGLHLQIFRSPLTSCRIYFYLYPFFVFAHIPIQTFLDLNAVFMLLQVSKYPNPLAPGIPGSGRNWALGAAAYIACWLVWILLVTIIYETIYSFFRRWRIKRPAMMPLYLSSSAHNYVCMTSYNNFCFMKHLRMNAFMTDHGSLRDGLAETFYFYSQNLPTVALLLPRAALSLALLLAYGNPLPLVVLDNTTVASSRDPVFFDLDGSLSHYAKGVLIANAAWTAWRILVLLCSWIGLWFLSEQGCAGLCGPRFRWEEEEVEKRRYSYLYGDAGSEDLGSTLAWSWRQCTRMRIQHAFEFCLTTERPKAWAEKEDEAGDLDDQVVMAAIGIGIPSVPPPTRPSVLSRELFQDPKGTEGMQALDDIIPQVVKRSSKERQQIGEPYPFTMRGAQISSADKMVPFPSPTRSREREQSPSSAATSGSTDKPGATEDSIASSAKTKGTESVSSFGQPLSSRYPFQFRQSPHRGNVRETTAHDEHDSSTSNHGTSGSGPEATSESSGSNASQSSVEVTSTESEGATSSPEEQRNGSESSSGSSIPMPPRHPQPAERRSRARGRPSTAPEVTSAASPAVAPPVIFPRTQTSIPAISAPGYEEQRHQAMDDDQSIVSSHYEDDSVGLLSSTSALSHRSPRPSFIASMISGIRGDSPGSRTQSLSSAGSSGSSSSPVPPSTSRSYRSSFGSMNVGGGAASRSASRVQAVRARTSSASAYVRSRAQSLMQGIGAASHSSIELAQSVINRSRTDSMARLDEGEHEYEGGIVGDTMRVQPQSHISRDSGNNELDVPHDDEHEGDDGLEYDNRVSRLYDVQQHHADITYQSDSNTHSRNASGGSGSAKSSSNENYTFGQPLPHRTLLQQVGEGQTVQEEVEGEDQAEEAKEEEEQEATTGHVLSSRPVAVAGGRQVTPDGSSVSSRSVSSRRRTRTSQPAPAALSPMRPRTYHTATTAAAVGEGEPASDSLVIPSSAAGGSATGSSASANSNSDSGVGGVGSQ